MKLEPFTPDQISKHNHNRTGPMIDVGYDGWHLYNDCVKPHMIDIHRGAMMFVSANHRFWTK